ncbi:hypothetical protein C8F01DRAFT_1294108 [Mycena amicta]|nr:hypothetical protein C8F01DRAFT_1294108 [Mycena amicta]
MAKCIELLSTAVSEFIVMDKRPLAVPSTLPMDRVAPYVVIFHQYSVSVTVFAGSVCIGGMSHQLSNSAFCIPRGISLCPSAPTTTSRPLRGTSSSAPLDRAAPICVLVSSPSSAPAPHLWHHTDYAWPLSMQIVPRRWTDLVWNAARRRQRCRQSPRRARMRAVCAVAMSQAPAGRHSGFRFSGLTTASSSSARSSIHPLLYKLPALRTIPSSLSSHPLHHQHHYPLSTLHKRQLPCSALLAPSSLLTASSLMVVVLSLSLLPHHPPHARPIPPADALPSLNSLPISSRSCVRRRRSRCVGNEPNKAVRARMPALHMLPR